MTKLFQPAVLALSMIVAGASSTALYAQDSRDKGEKAGDATERAVEKAGDGAEKGIDAAGKGVGAAVEHTTRGAVKAADAIGDFFDDDVEIEGIDQDNVKDVQQALTERGYYDGRVDGIAGDKTRASVKAFQEHENLPVTGRINAATLEALHVK